MGSRGRVAAANRVVTIIIRNAVNAFRLAKENFLVGYGMI
jgi:hypothetical protein